MILMAVSLWLGGALVGFAIGVRLTARRYRRAVRGVVLHFPPEGVRRG